MNIVLPEHVKTIIKRLNSCGHEAYAVGGCVRDSILGKRPADWDITTSASPQEVKGLFSHTIDTGIEHGTVTVMLDHMGYEVTTYRIDGEYLDGRHPKEVVFTSLLSEDLRRRDFTINAMAYNDGDGLVDLFDGLGDLQRGVIRCVGRPEERFSEDALRMLRALRFSAQLGFSIDEATYDAITKLAPTISKVSMERITTELVKLLVSEHPEKIVDVYESGLTKEFMPEFDLMMTTPQNTKHHCYTVGWHTIHALMSIPAEKHLRLAMLLHDVAKPCTRRQDQDGIDHFYGHQEKGAEMAVAIMRRWKLDNETIAKVKRLVRFHDERPNIERNDIRRAVVTIGVEAFPDLFLVKRADTLAQSTYQREEKLAALAGFETLYEDIIKSGECVTKKQLAVSGSDLLALGVPQGKAIGQILDRLFSMVVEDPSKNNRVELMNQANKIKNLFIQ